MDVICQCGKIQFKTPLPKPLAVYICHCDECRRQSSSAFGCSAIFPRFPLPSPELMSVYTRPTASGHLLNCYFCRGCGTRLIHSTPGKNVVSVKGGAIEGLDWSEAKHIWCKRAMVPIPEGVEQSPEQPLENLRDDPEGWGQDEGIYGSGYSNRDSGGCGERSIKVPNEGNKGKGWDVDLSLVQ